MRRRIQVEPWRSALAWVWRTRSVEGVFGHYIANGAFARGVAAGVSALNTDDRTCLEFAFSRTVGQHITGFDLNKLYLMARQRGCAVPRLQGGELNAQRTADERMSSLAAEGQWSIEVESDSAAFRTRTRSKSAFGRGEFVAAAQAWLEQPEEPEDLTELLLVALGLAQQGDVRALPCIERLRAWVPIEADAVEAQLLWRQGRPKEAFAKADQALQAFHTDPWPTKRVMEILMGEAKDLARRPGQEVSATRLLETLRSPFAVNLLEDERTQSCLDLANHLGRAQIIREVVAGLEPHVPWTRSFLELRSRIYALTSDPQAGDAAADLMRFEAKEAEPFPFKADEGMAARSERPGTVERVQARGRP
jgi:spermidine synthase